MQPASVARQRTDSICKVRFCQFTPIGHKRAPRLRAGDLQAAIELSDVMLAQKEAHSQLAQGTPDLSEAMMIHPVSGLRRQPEMAPPIAILGAEHAFLFDHFFRPCQRRNRRFLFYQLR